MHTEARPSLPAGSAIEPPVSARSKDTIGSVCDSTRYAVMPLPSLRVWTLGSRNGRSAVGGGWVARNASSGNASSCGAAVCAGTGGGGGGIGFSSGLMGGGGGTTATGAAGLAAGLGQHAARLWAMPTSARVASVRERSGSQLLAVTCPISSRPWEIRI